MNTTTIEPGTDANTQGFIECKIDFGPPYSTLTERRSTEPAGEREKP